MDTAQVVTLAITGENEQFKRTIRDSRRELQSFANDAAVIGQGITAMGVGMLASFAGATAIAVRNSKAFTMASVTLGKSYDDIGTAQVKQTLASIDSMHTIDQLASSMEYLGQAGIDTTKQLENNAAAIKLVDRFSTVGQFSLKKATDLLTDAETALRGVEGTFQSSANQIKNMEIIADYFVKISSAANTSVREISEAMTNKAAAAMKTFNVGLEDGIVLLGMFASAGIKGRTAGTTFEQTLKYATQSFVKNKEEYEKAGIELFDAEGQFNMENFIETLNKSLGDLDAPARVQRLMDLGVPMKGAIGMQMLLGRQGQFAAMRDNMNAQEDLTKRFQRIMNSLWGVITRLKTELYKFATVIADAATPIIKIIIPAIYLMVKVFTTLLGMPIVKHILTLAMAFAVVSGAILVTVGVVSLLISATTLYSAALVNLVGSVMSLEINAILLTTALLWKKFIAIVANTKATIASAGASVLMALGFSTATASAWGLVAALSALSLGLYGILAAGGALIGWLASVTGLDLDIEVDESGLEEVKDKVNEGITLKLYPELVWSGMQGEAYRKLLGQIQGEQINPMDNYVQGVMNTAKTPLIGSHLTMDRAEGMVGDDTPDTRKYIENARDSHLERIGVLKAAGVSDQHPAFQELVEQLKLLNKALKSRKRDQTRIMDNWNSRRGIFPRFGN